MGAYYVSKLEVGNLTNSVRFWHPNTRRRFFEVSWVLASEYRKKILLIQLGSGIQIEETNSLSQLGSGIQILEEDSLN